MSRAGNRVTPESGRATDAPPGRPTGSTGTRSGVPAVRWWPRARPRAGSDDGTGRWGVARLVAQREAERRGAEGPHDPDVAGPDTRSSADRAADEPIAADSVDEPAPELGEHVSDDATTDDPAPVDEATDDAVTDAGVDAAAVTDGAVTGDAATDDGRTTDPDDVPPPRAPLPPEPACPPSPRTPLRTPLPVPRPPLPRPRRPYGVLLGPVVPNASDERASRPRVEPDPSLFGFARHTRGRLGGRLFTLFFVLVFAVIVIQTVASIV